MSKQFSLKHNIEVNLSNAISNLEGQLGYNYRDCAKTLIERALKDLILLDKAIKKELERKK